MSKPREYIEIVLRVYPMRVTSRILRERSADARRSCEHLYWSDAGDLRRPRVASVKRVCPEPPTKPPRARQHPCFSCVDKDARYADGLCEACHRIAVGESDRMKGAKR
jgi:hypothetical protein